MVKTDGVTWLMDRAERVLCFDPDRVEFGCGRLTPGGVEMFPRPGMHWSGGGMLRPYWGNTSHRRYRLCQFQASAGRRLASFRVITRPENGVVESDWRMDVHYDSGLRSYIYDVTTTATVFKTPAPETYDPIEFEYFDLFTNGLLDNKTAYQLFEHGRHHPVPGPLWGYLVYDKDVDSYDCNRYWVKAPLNRLITAAQNNVQIKRDGWIGFMHNPAGNPMVQLLGDTAAFTRVHMCNWFYDLHFSHFLRFVKAPPARGFTAAARLRIANFDSARCRPILAGAQWLPPPAAERQAKAYPRYEERRVNSFERGISLNCADHARIWRPFHDHPLYAHFGQTDVRLHGDGLRHALFPKTFTNPRARCRWDRSLGRTGAASLQVVTAASAVAGWNLPVFEAPQVAPGRRYRLSVWIKTRALRGRGATLACFLDPYVVPWTLSERDPQRERKPLFAGHWIRGNAEWQQVELITPVMENKRYSHCFEYDLCHCAIQPILWHAGRGASWFDDFVLEKLNH